MGSILRSVNCGRPRAWHCQTGEMMAPVGAKNWRKMASPVYILHLISTHFFSVRVAYSNCKKTLVFYMCNAMRAHGAKFKFYYFDFFLFRFFFEKGTSLLILETLAYSVCLLWFFLKVFFPRIYLFRSCVVVVIVLWLYVVLMGVSFVMLPMM